MDAVQIPLQAGQFALVSPDDAAPVLDHPYQWIVGGEGYVESWDIDGKQRIRLHRLLMGFPPCRVDHKNGNRLDCTRANLRLASGVQNAANRRKIAGTSSQYKGVTFRKDISRWRAGIQCGGKPVFLGHFTTEEAAARAYDDAAIRLFGEFARTNFEQGAPA